MTGVSGSGKSSLAFDTIYAEGQRRYVESLSAYARQFLERMEKPAVEEIDGIAPAVAIRQKNTSRNPRSTVATSTECYDFLRLLFARIGQTFCPTCGTRVRRDTVDEAAARMLELPRGLALVCAIRGGRTRRRGLAARSPFRAAQERLQPAFPGRENVRILHARIAARDRFREASVYPGRPHRHRARSASAAGRYHRNLLSRSRRSDLRSRRGSRQIRFNEKFQCKTCGTEFNPPEPILFSFNSPFGACPRCQGFGNTIDFDMDRIDPRQDALARRRRGRAVDQAEVPLLAGELQEIGEGRALSTFRTAI